MSLRSHNSFVIKVCGITTEEDALAASEAGATAVGLNFYQRSPRYITADRASRIAASFPNAVLRVGVFVNPTAEELHRAVDEIPLDIVQVHGSIPEKTPAGLRVWKAATVDGAFSFEKLDGRGIEAFLLDAPAADYGGSGHTFEWSRARGIPAPFLLAGGLDASNVAEAIALTGPWGVDACSLLESSPGRKDLKKVRDFVEAAQRGFAALAQTSELVR
jgi:phosphoribosylanthranilate isomerase